MDLRPLPDFSSPLSVREALKSAINYLHSCEVLDPRSSAEVLLKEVLSLRDRSELWLYADRLLTPLEEEKFLQYIYQRGMGKPVAYLLGKKEFYDIELKVGSGVFIPRPETELIIEVALSLAQTLPPGAVADLGSGSGALALSLHRTLLRPTVAVEKSPQALPYLKENVERYGAPIIIIQGDFTRPLSPGKYALLVANPPYLSEAERGELPRELTYEPDDALFSGPTGLEAISDLASDAPRVLKPGGVLICEIGYSQAPAVGSLFSSWGSTLHFVEDLMGYKRVFWIRKSA